MGIFDAVRGAVSGHVQQNGGLGEVLGGLLANIASQLGLDPAQVSGQLAQMLPGIIDQLTPNGALPQGGLGQPADLMGLLGGLLNKG